MTQQTKAERIRAHLKAAGPQTTQQLMAAMGMSFAQVWGHCRPQVERGCLSFDPDIGYSYVRDARPNTGKRVDPQRRIEAERARSRARCTRRKEQNRAKRVANGLVGPVVRAERAAECRTKGERLAQAAQAMRNRQHGVPAVIPAPPKVQSVEEFLAGGGCVHRLRDGEVSPASRLKRISAGA